MTGAPRTVTIRAGRSKPLWFGHPWLFADSIDSIEDGDGDLVRVVDSDGKTIGHGWLSPSSLLRVRLLSRGDAPPDEIVLLRSRVEAAVSLRRRLFTDPKTTDAYRVVHGEGDGIPGLVVDRYGPVLVAQFSTRPLLRRREPLASILLAATGAASIVARGGGHEDDEGIAAEEVSFEAGAPCPDFVDAREAGLLVRVDLRRGQKTGHYVDQRESRVVVAQVSRGARVLDLYAGTGGFSLQALKAGAASATAVDSSGPALAAASAGAVANGVAGGLATVEADVMEHLAALGRAGERYDLVVVDPPRFAATHKGLAKALQAYRHVNVRAMTRVAPGGYLATFSCSGLVDAQEFASVVLAASRDCARRLTVLRTLSAGPDHPVSLAAPVGRYLTGLLLRVEA